MGSKGAPSWADQWGTGGDDYYKEPMPGNDKKKLGSGGGKKMEDVKVAAAAGLGKAKAAATVGAQKVKTGTSFGIKWMKNQYQKTRSSSK